MCNATWLLITRFTNPRMSSDSRCFQCSVPVDLCTLPLRTQFNPIYRNVCSSRAHALPDFSLSSSRSHRRHLHSFFSPCCFSTALQPQPWQRRRLSSAVYSRDSSRFTPRKKGAWPEVPTGLPSCGCRRTQQLDTHHRIAHLD